MKFEILETVVLKDSSGHVWRIGDETIVSLSGCTSIGGEIQDLSTKEIVIKNYYLDQPIRIKLSEIHQIDEY
jgi:hypothetical protein